MPTTKIAWQTPVAIFLMTAQFGLGALLGAASVAGSGVTIPPIAALVLVPTMLFGTGAVLNQLKSIGALPPGTTKTTTERTETPPST